MATSFVDTSGLSTDMSGITFDPNQPSDIGVPPWLSPNPPVIVISGVPDTSGTTGATGSGDTLSGIAAVLGSAAGVFNNVWRTVNPPQVGQINPVTGVPYGINPTTGLPYSTTFGITGANSNILLLGGLAILAILLLRK